MFPINICSPRFDDCVAPLHRGSDLPGFTIASRISELCFGFQRTFRGQGDLDEAFKEISASVKRWTGRRDAGLGRSMNFVQALTYQARILGGNEGINLGRSKERRPFSRAPSYGNSLSIRTGNDQSTRGNLARAGFRSPISANTRLRAVRLLLRSHLRPHGRNQDNGISGGLR